MKVITVNWTQGELLKKIAQLLAVQSKGQNYHVQDFTSVV